MADTVTAVAPLRPATYREKGEAAPASLFLAPATLLVLVMLLLPLLLLLRFSLNRYDPTELMIEMVTAENYVRFVSDPFYLDVLRTTLLVAVASTLLCLIFGMLI